MVEKVGGYIQRISRGNEITKTFDYLRFYLIIGVVFIHNYTLIRKGAFIDVSRETTPLLAYSSDFFSQVLGRLSVPLFFFISVYLFFYNIESFNKCTYCDKLKNRVRSLVIPYLIWNLIYLLSSPISFSDFDIMGIIGYMWGDLDPSKTDVFPIAYQFWYIRDLMIVVLFTPLIYCYRTNIILLAIGLLFFLFNVYIPYLGTRGFSTEAFFFFSCGAFGALNRKKYELMCNVNKSFKWVLICLYIVLAMFDLSTKGTSFNIYIHRVGILLGCTTLLLITKGMVENGKCKPNRFLIKSSFFVFAVHVMLLPIIKKGILCLFYPQTDLELSILYLGNVALTVIVSVLIYFISQKYLPVVTRFMTGGR